MANKFDLISYRTY